MRRSRGVQPLGFSGAQWRRRRPAVLACLSARTASVSSCCAAAAPVMPPQQVPSSWPSQIEAIRFDQPLPKVNQVPRRFRKPSRISQYCETKAFGSARPRPASPTRRGSAEPYGQGLDRDPEIGGAGGIFRVIDVPAFVGERDQQADRETIAHGQYSDWEKRRLKRTIDHW